ncbi:hypothetical protein RJP56_05395 [Shewanella baltica]|uniref:EAL domain-containing protein n=1 Tax=Shewanella baltica TaxID=62322 RepID=UPI0028712FD9|nr:hypothetical protein [Shewanella baltica]MDR9765493.1 hypothetical protein [Shewanella baltica]
MNLIKCNLANNAGEHLTLLPNIRPFYKEQLIFSNKLSALGCEILIDFDSVKYYTAFFSNVLMPDIQSDIIKYDSFLHDTLMYCMNNIDRYISSSFRYIFINMEVSSLCNVSSLALINQTQQMLSINGMDLVVEITERNNCGNCARTYEGIEFLVNNGILLAADDFDYIENDFRARALRSLVYTFVKLEFPQNKDDEKKFYDIINSSKKLGINIIVERIEDKKSIEEPLFEDIWGLQGFALCKGMRFN